MIGALLRLGLGLLLLPLTIMGVAALLALSAALWPLILIVVLAIVGASLASGR